MCRSAVHGSVTYSSPGVQLCATVSQYIHLDLDIIYTDNSASIAAKRPDLDIARNALETQVVQTTSDQAL